MSRYDIHPSCYIDVFFHHIFRSFSANLSLVFSMNLMVLLGQALDHFLSGFECNPLKLKLLEGELWLAWYGFIVSMVV